MAGAAVDLFSQGLRHALVVGPRDDDDDLPNVEHIPGEHPLPGRRSVDAAARALEIARATRLANEPLLVLLSGGASAMLAAPADGVSLEDKRHTTESLMRSGANIAQLNCVRKHLSAIKGGRLAAAAARCVTLAVSDVHDPPDDPATIASGPTVADPTSYDDALRVITTLHADVPPAVIEYLQAGAAGRRTETVKPGDAALQHSVYEVIANRHTAMDAAAVEAARSGHAVHVINRATRGEASDAGRVFAELAVATLPPAGRVCVIASGETTVTVRGQGRGGRNQEFVLGAAAVLAHHPAPALLVSVGTDGTDGPTDAAGAVVDSTTLVRAGGQSIARALEANDTYPLLARLGDLVKWGPTFTNVGDLHILITMCP
jgi:glycerate-2-kinase